MTRNIDMGRVRHWANRKPQPNVEARVLSAILRDAAFLAAAPDLEIYDFTSGTNRTVFTAVRNLEATDSPFLPNDVAQYIAMRAAEYVDKWPERAEWEAFQFHRSYLSHLLSTADIYELVVFDAALVVFEADCRQLRLIAKEQPTYAI